MGAAVDCPERPRDDTATRVQMGDIVRVFGDALRGTSALTGAQHEVLVALARCRTAALGGHLAVCDACGHATPVYNSCRNRHCPTCQGLDQHRWLEARRERILRDALLPRRLHAARGTALDRPVQPRVPLRDALRGRLADAPGVGA